MAVDYTIFTGWRNEYCFSPNLAGAPRTKTVRYYNVLEWLVQELDGKVNGVKRSYDKNRNQVKRTIGGSAYTLSYDAENRPSGCSLRTCLSGVSGAATASFVYDGDGVRVKATAGGVTTAYVGNYFEWTGSTSTMVKYYYAGATRVAMRVGSNNPKWLLSDHLGSQSIVASYDGLTEEGELRYKAWGETRYTSGTTPT